MSSITSSNNNTAVNSTDDQFVNEAITLTGNLDIPAVELCNDTHQLTCYLLIHHLFHRIPDNVGAATNKTYMLSQFFASDPRVRGWAVTDAITPNCDMQKHWSDRPRLREGHVTWLTRDAHTCGVPGSQDRKSTRLNSSHSGESRMPSSA